MEDSYYVIDRVESEVAVLVGDDGKKQDVPISSLPKGACGGSCWRKNGDAFLLDEAEEERREQRITSKLDALFVD